MSKRTKLIIAILLMGTAIVLDVLKGMDYEILNEESARLITGALFGAGISILVIVFMNNKKQKEMS
ncbi:hypothetical protein L3073_10120 [Ancylomarina sp. DW003]|nr:hypothetical protein [Ancylomarina sp. DW003]MDE5422561.1 hypothetical protein [Ancylomarina sp. DW003]